MKTKDIIITALIVLVVIIGFVVSANYNSKDEDTNESSRLKEITYTEYEALLASDDAVVIYVGRPTCSACVSFIPNLEEVLEENDLYVNYLNTDNLSNEELSKVASSTEYFSTSGIRTPHTMVIKNKTVVDTLLGAAAKENIISFFQANGLI